MPEGLLEAIAEIGVSLAGFAGIVGALAGRQLRPGDRGLWLPFWVMIAGGLCVVFAALFPLLLFYLGVSGRLVWADSSGLVSLMSASGLAIFTPRFLRRPVNKASTGVLTFQILLYLTSFLLLVSQMLNTFGIGMHQSVGGFLVGLYLMLLISALNFVFLLYTWGAARRFG